MEYVVHVLILIGIYVIAASSLNLSAGYTGLLSVAHAVFVGIGSYVTALLAIHFGWSFWWCMPASMLVSAVVSIAASLPALRVNDDYLVLATFALQVIATSILINWVDFTGGPLGLPGIPQPTVGDFAFGEKWQFLVLVWGCAAVVGIVIRRLVISPYGRVLQAIREDEVLSSSFGKNVLWYKVGAFAMGAVLAAPAGCLYAVYITYIDPSSFSVMESIFLLSIVIIGGSGTLMGPVVGAVFLVSLPEALRFVGLPNVATAQIRQILYGTLLVIVLLTRPNGIVGGYWSHTIRKRRGH